MGQKKILKRFIFIICFIFFFVPGGDPVLLSGGIHSFPFKLGLPLGLPSTFLGKHGWVQYFCKAALREESGLTHKNQQVFIIMNPIDLNLEPPILAVRFIMHFFFKNQQSRSSTQRIYVYKNSSLSPLFFSLKLESTCNRPKQRGWAVEMPQIYSNLYTHVYIYTLKFQCRKQILGIPTQAFLAFKFFFLHQAVARNNLDSLTQYQASLKQVIFFTICIIISKYILTL